MTWKNINDGHDRELNKQDTHTKPHMLPITCACGYICVSSWIEKRLRSKYTSILTVISGFWEWMNFSLNFALFSKFPSISKCFYNQKELIHFSFLKISAVITECGSVCVLHEACLRNTEIFTCERKLCLDWLKMVADGMEMKQERPLGMATRVYYTICFCMWEKFSIIQILKIYII